MTSKPVIFRKNPGFSLKSRVKPRFTLQPKKLLGFRRLGYIYISVYIYWKYFIFANKLASDQIIYIIQKKIYICWNPNSKIKYARPLRGFRILRAGFQWPPKKMKVFFHLHGFGFRHLFVLNSSARILSIHVPPNVLGKVPGGGHFKNFGAFCALVI